MKIGGVSTDNTGPVVDIHGAIEEVEERTARSASVALAWGAAVCFVIGVYHIIHGLFSKTETVGGGHNGKQKEGSSEDVQG